MKTTVQISDEIAFPIIRSADPAALKVEDVEAALRQMSEEDERNALMFC